MRLHAILAIRIPFHSILGLCRQLRKPHSTAKTITHAENLQDALSTREWREGFLPERIRDEILLDQILIETDGEMIGQINALSVMEFPAILAHLVTFTISCVVHVGDGEFTE